MKAKSVKPGKQKIKILLASLGPKGLHPRRIQQKLILKKGIAKDEKILCLTVGNPGKAISPGIVSLKLQKFAFGFFQRPELNVVQVLMDQSVGGQGLSHDVFAHCHRKEFFGHLADDVLVFLCVGVHLPVHPFATGDERHQKLVQYLVADFFVTQAVFCYFFIVGGHKLMVYSLNTG